MSKQTLNVEGILNTLSSIRQQVPYLAKAPAPVDSTRTSTFLPAGGQAIEDFELSVLADALESFAGELSVSIETAQQKAMADALEVYYAAERLSKEPEHAHLIPYVEQMRAIYRRDFGTEIPQRQV
jgi:hypothetical protein